MKIALLALSLFALSAQAVTVTCTGTIQGKKQGVTLNLNSKGKIVQWDENRWAKSQGSYLGVFGKNIEDYGFEWDKSFVARNGYSILELGTTADSHTVGVNLSQGLGFYTYKDLGSGAGDLGPVTLNCK